MHGMQVRAGPRDKEQWTHRLKEVRGSPAAGQTPMHWPACL